MPKKKKKRGNGKLSRFVICLSGRLARTHSEIEGDITENGGKCKNSITEDVTHLVCTNAELHRGSAKVINAQNFNIPIVTEVRPAGVTSTPFHDIHTCPHV